MSLVTRAVADLRWPGLILSLGLLGCLGLSGCKILPDPRPVTPPLTPGQPTPPPGRETPDAITDEPHAEPGATPDHPPTDEPAAGAGLPLPDLPPLPEPAGEPLGVAVVREPWTAPEEATETGTEAATEATLEARRGPIREGIDRVRAWLRQTGRRAVMVSEPANYAWLTGGADNRIDPAAPPAALAVLLDRVLVVAPSDILPAALAGVRGLGYHGLTYAWDISRDAGVPVRALQPLVGDGVIAADVPRPGTELVADDLVDLRLPLRADQAERLHQLGSQTTAAVADSLSQVSPETTERELADRLRQALDQAGLTVRHVGVAALTDFAERGFDEPGDQPLAEGAAVQVVAAADGLTVTVGRTVAPEPTRDAVDAMTAAREVYARLLAAVQPDALLRDLYSAAARAAAAVGQPELYRAYPPGGVGAYEPLARLFQPRSVERLVPTRAVTLQVRLPHAYLADTLLVEPDRVRIITATDAEPAPALYVNHRVVGLPTLRGGEQPVAQAEHERLTAAAQAAVQAAAVQRVERYLDRLRSGLAEAEPTAEPTAADAPSEASAAESNEP